MISQKETRMILSVTGKTQAGPNAPLVYRGKYEDMIPAAAAIGYDAMELHIHDSAQLDRAGLKKLFDQSKITLSSIGTGSAYGEDRIFLSSDDPAVRQRAIKRIQDHIVTAKDYSGAVVIIGLIKGMVRDCSSRDACLKNLGESMRVLLDSAARDKVMLVFEVINRYESDLFNTIAETAAFVDTFNSPWMKLHIDTFHMNIEETDIAAAIRGAKGKIGHVHLADSDRWYAGHGHYNFGETVRALRDIGYDKALAVESLMFPDSETSARKTFATMKACM